jgi:hypothetical protein
MWTWRLLIVRVAALAVAMLVIRSAAAHEGHRPRSAGANGHHPQCFSDPPPRNSEGPPEEEGFWEDVVDIGVQAIHAIHLPVSGKILIWGYNHGQRTSAPGLLYNPATGATENILVGTAAFCAGHSHLPDGRIFISGGRNSGGVGTIFNPFTETFSAPIPVYGSRFYPTHTSLSDGRVFISGAIGRRSAVPEIFDPATETTAPVGCLDLGNGRYRCDQTRLRLHYYPRVALGEGDNLLVLPASRPMLARTFDFAQSLWVSHPSPADPQGLWRPAPTVYYAEGKALRAGTDSYASSSKAVGVTTVVEFDDIFNPTERTVAPMAYARNRNTLTLLADGKVLATGGKRSAPCTAGDPNVYHPEIWDPATEQWETLGPMQNTRVYHSSAILLRDGSVLSAGGEPRQTTSQIFRPPYLFRGPRPTVTSAPAQIAYATPFDVFTPDAASIQAVNLLRPGAVTHAYDQAQRFVPLSFTAAADRVVVTGPEEPYDAPPGYYMLFLISDQGVPSVAEYVRVLPSPWW